MGAYSLVTYLGLSVIMSLVGIDCLTRKRLFQGPGVPLVYDKETYVIDEIYVAGFMHCALHCVQPDCSGFLYRDPDLEWPDDYCYSSPDRFGYTGRRNTTMSGLECQRWDSQTPYSHYMDADLIPESSLTEAQNYCRCMDGTLSIWCYTMDSCCRHEPCNVAKCLAKGKNCRLYSLSTVPYGTWTGYRYYQQVETTP